MQVQKDAVLGWWKLVGIPYADPFCGFLSCGDFVLLSVSLSHFALARLGRSTQSWVPQLFALGGRPTPLYSNLMQRALDGSVEKLCREARLTDRLGPDSVGPGHRCGQGEESHVGQEEARDDVDHGAEMHERC